MTDFFCNCCESKSGTIVHTGLTSVYTSNKWNIASCNNCGNNITLPVPDRKTLDDIYSNTYLYPVHHLILGEKMMRAKDLAKYIRKITGKGKKIFEVGCMFGYLLLELQNGNAVKGIEIGEEAVDVCRRHGLDVTDMSLENYLLNNTEKFDVIILSHVFEHLLSCDQILKQLADRLNESGMIILCVPNSESISRKMFGKDWGWWQVPVHINHFSKKPLSLLAERLGLKVDAVRFKGGDSLMLLLNFINMFRFHKGGTPGPIQKGIIRIWTMAFRYWYYVGDEELTVVVKKK